MWKREGPCCWAYKVMTQERFNCDVTPTVWKKEELRRWALQGGVSNRFFEAAGWRHHEAVVSWRWHGGAAHAEQEDGAS